MTEIDKSFADEVANCFLPTIIEQIINQGYISKSNASSELEAVYKVLSNSEALEEIIGSIGIRISISDSLKISINDALSKNQLYSAAILAGVCCENIINEFYFMLLANNYSMTDSEVDSAIKCMNIKDKCTWFFRITTGKQLGENLLSKIISINSIRNFFVHYKPHAISLGYEQTEIDRVLQKHGTTISEALSIINELQSFCDQTLINSTPEARKAHEILTEMLTTKPIP